MIKKLISIMLVYLLLGLSLAGCITNTNNSSLQPLRYYAVRNKSVGFEGIIWEYNDQCKKIEDRIEIVEFDDEEELTTKLTTELMAGCGPDIISLATISRCSLSFDKLLTQKIFANIDEVINQDTSANKIKMDDYNQAALNAGVFQGERFFIPAFYEPDMLTTTKEKIEKYSKYLKNGLTIEAVLRVYDAISREENKIALFQAEDEYETLLYRFIDENVDFSKKLHSFDTVSFKRVLYGIGDIIKKEREQSNSNENERNFMFSAAGVSNLLSFAEACVNTEEKGESLLVLNGVSANPANATANIYEAFAINNGTDNKQKALPFIKFLLSEQFQNDFCGASVTTYDPISSNGIGWYYPVNINSFKQLKKTAQKLTYGKNNKQVNDKMLDSFVSKVDQIKDYRLYVQYEYYNNKVIGENVENFLNSEITKDQFINQLISKTEIYFNE